MEKLPTPSTQESSAKRSFSIRTMEIYDLAEVYKLGEMSFTADLWPTLYRSWSPYEVTELFNTDGDYCLVAENDADDAPPGERIVGFVLGTVINKTHSAWSYGYVIWLCSHPHWLREGVASRLVDKLIERMIENDGIRIIMADTDPENIRAVKFFEKKGFTQQKAHVYLSSNLEHNEQYAHLLKASRATALDVEYLKKIRRLNEQKATHILKSKKKKKSKKKRKKMLKHKARKTRKKS